MDRDNAYLHHISDSMQKTEEYIKGLDYQQFVNNQMAQSAVIRELEIIGEASKRLSSQLKEKHAEIPWKDIAGTRDKLIHDYFAVDLEAVWKMVKEDLPIFKKQVLDLLS